MRERASQTYSKACGITLTLSFYAVEDTRLLLLRNAYHSGAAAAVGKTRKHEQCRGQETDDQLSPDSCHSPGLSRLERITVDILQCVWYSDTVRVYAFISEILCILTAAIALM